MSLKDLKEVFEAREKSEIDNKVKEIFEKTGLPILCNYETEVHPELWYTIFNSGFRYGYNEGVDGIEEIINKE